MGYTECEDPFRPRNLNHNAFSPFVSTSRRNAESPNANPVIQKGKSRSGPSDYVMFLWNKNLSAYEYHLAVCTDRCLDGRLVRLNSSLGCPNIACFPCDCEMPECEIYSTCCPDLLETGRLYRSEFRLARSNGIDLNRSHPFLFSDTLFGIERNLSVGGEIPMDDKGGTNFLWAKLKPYPVCNKATVGPSYLHIKSCLNGHENQIERMGCESDFSAQNQSVLNFQHVTDNSTGVSYYNEFCAACNEVQSEMAAPWSVEIECNHFMHVYSALDRDSFLRLSLQPGSTCKVYQIPPGKDSTDIKGKDVKEDSYRASTKCDPRWFGSVLSSCNFTGQWKARDEDIEAACQQMDHLTLRVFDFRQSRDVYFKNIFCAICNTGDYPWFYDTCEDGRGDGQVPVSSLPFSLLLGTKRRSPVRKVLYSPFAECPASQWAGPDGLCYSLKCAAGKTLDLGEKVCKTALPGISGLGYSMQLYYEVKPKFKVELNSSLFETALRDEKFCTTLYLNAFKTKIISTMTSLSASGEFFFNTVLDSKSIRELNSLIGKEEKDEVKAQNESMVHHPSLFALTSKFTDNKHIDRDAFEKSVVSELIEKDLEVRITDDHVLVLTPVSVLDGFDLFKDCSSLTEHFKEHKCCSGRLIRFVFGIEPADSIWSTAEKFLPLNLHLSCPYINFNKTQYDIIADMTQIPPTFNVTLTFDKIQFNFTLPFERNMLALDTESLIVCYDVLQSKVSEMTPSYILVADEDDGALRLSQYILTMIFLGLSILCLILTLMTYFFFSSLRSAAGMNNIFLCLTLVCAQILLVAAAHIKSSGLICKIIAISTHFFWLCMFCWSFACCFHMYRIFTAKTRRTGGSPRSLRFEVLKKAFLCALFPILVVSAVVLYSMLANDRLGYGKVGCFLDPGHLILITVIAPLCGILLCNIFFFLSTVMKIYSVRKLQSGENIKKDDRQNLYIYIKLSSMTGAFWAVATLAENLDNEPLRYISILLNGLQGVFIFMSYIANRRVLNMYLRAIGLEEHIPATSSTSSTDRSTLAKAASALQKHEQPKPKPEVKIGPNTGTQSSSQERKPSVISKDSGCRDGDDVDGDSEANGEGDRPACLPSAPAQNSHNN
ncbi:adhesion G protein-coupled receptor L2 [Elysia marginata]|uniref:Adhesion G protein-coupled receptor L2 n=1 Tax=Elysia marginata TaxID=1093978 RepID=A0AAV4I7N1_9GAST|nr:adhesion G protein-coupled receptor L2 [Elysia marginata]